MTPFDPNHKCRSLSQQRMGEPCWKPPNILKRFPSRLMLEAERAFLLSPVVDSGAMAMQRITNSESPSPGHVSRVLHLGNVTIS